MQRSSRSLGILVVMTLAGNSPIKAHTPMMGIASAASGASVGPHSPSESTVAIQIFQYQPGRVKIIAGRRIYVAFGIASVDMATIANPLADAIVMQFPERYAPR